MIGLDRLVSVPVVPVSAVSGVTPTLHSHVIVITLVLRSKQTNILIDIKGMEGGVRATSILCLLGIGVGLGSFLAYKIYSKFFPPALTSATQTTRCRCCRRRYAEPEEQEEEAEEEEKANSGQGEHLPYLENPELLGGSIPVSFTSTPSTALLLDLDQSTKTAPEGELPGAHPMMTSSSSGWNDGWLRHRGGSRGRSHCRTDSTGSDGFMVPPPGGLNMSMYSSYSSDLGFSSGVPPDSMETLHSDSEESCKGHQQAWCKDNKVVNNFKREVEPRGSILQNHCQSWRRHPSSSLVANSAMQAGAPPTEAPSQVIGARSGSGSHQPVGGSHSMSTHSSPAHSSRSSGQSSRKRAAPDDESDEEDQVFLKRQPLSFCSDIAEMSTRDYLLCRYGVDVEEDLSRESTPDPDDLGKEEFGTSTVQNIDKIQRELSNIQQDINEMTHDVYLLQSKENLLNLDESLNHLCGYDFDVNCNPSCNKYPTGRLPGYTPMLRSRSRSRSLSRARSLSTDSVGSHASDASELRKCSQNFGDFMWDYQSDLLASTVNTSRGAPGASQPQQQFVAKRPRFSNSGVHFDSDGLGSGSSCEGVYSGWEAGGSLCRSCKDEEGGSTSPSWMVENVGRKYNMFEYAEKRRKNGPCCESKAVKEGLQRLPSLLGRSHLRQVRRDYYCPLRATLYQALVNNLPLVRHIGAWPEILKRLDVFQQYSYLQKWTFANRMPYSKGHLYEKVVECVKSLYDLIAVIYSLEDQPSREEYLAQQLNSQPKLDLQLMEACKLLMMLHAIWLHEKMLAGHGVPLFVRLLYGKEGMGGPEMVLRNMLNPLGDERAMGQLDLFLLGHTLGVKIEVVRPSRYQHEDYISHYPDEGADSYPKVYLAEEGEGHFSVLCQ